MADKVTSLHEFFAAEKRVPCALPLFVDRICAGFPSPAEQYVSATLDLNDLLIDHPSATFFVRVKGDSMINAGISTNDLVIVDRSLPALHNKIIIARIDNELTIKRISYEHDKIILYAENDAYKPLYVTADSDFEVWGVITYVIHKV